MAGLYNFLQDTQQTQTTMPAWYDAAQQQIVSQGTQAAGAAPQLGQTVAQGAINTLQPGAQNPFTQAQNTLQQISSGAANPWIVDQATGAVTPNVNTAMGGLFAAEQNQLNQLLPTKTAPIEAGAIGSGNFGSLRGQTAVDTAKANALSTLQAQQMAAALQNQQYGSQAAANLGTVAGQGISNEMNVGLAQQNAPFQNIGNLASLLGTLQAPTTTTSQKQASPLTQASQLANIYTGAGGNALTGGLGALLFGSPAVAAAGNTPAKAAVPGILGSLYDKVFSGSSNPNTNIMGGGITQPTNPVDVTQLPGYDSNSSDYGSGTTGIE